MVTLHSRRSEHRNKQPRDKTQGIYCSLPGAELSIRTDPEKLELLEKVRKNEKAAIEKMILTHTRLAISIVNRYIGVYGLSFYGQDLNSAALEGVVVAVNQIAKGKMVDHDNVTGYIVKYVHSYIIDAVNRNSIIYTPRRKKNKIVKELSNILPKIDSQLSIQEFEAWDSIESLIDNDVEREILKLRKEGHNDREIGELIGLSRLQVFRIRRNLFQRYQKKERKNVRN